MHSLAKQLVSGGLWLCAAGLSAQSVTPNLEISIGPYLSESERAKTRPVALHEPDHGCYLGAYIELDPKLVSTYIDSNQRIRKLPEEFESIVGKRHASYFFYQGYGFPLPVDWIKLLADRNKIVHIALEPNDGLEAVKDDAYLRLLADQLKSTNARILLRFASEMNGEWTKYGGNPSLYRQKFRLVAAVMKQRAPNVAMVWCPYATPVGNIRSFYPGHDAVDWVGVNIYNVTYFDQNPSTPAHNVEPEDLLKFVYETYSKQKPIMIGEYATTHFSRLENRSIPTFAVNNIRSIYASLRSKFPDVKAIYYFSSNNLLIRHAANNNYALTADPQVLEAYREAITPDYFLSEPRKPTQLPEKLEDGSLLLQGQYEIRAALVGANNGLIRFTLDGRVIHSKQTSKHARAFLDSSQLTPGKHTLVAEAFNGEGKTVATAKQLITIPTR